MTCCKKLGIGIAVVLPPMVGMIAAMTVTKRMAQVHYNWTHGCPKCDEEREAVLNGSK